MMTTKVEVQRAHSTSTDVHTVEGKPNELSAQINRALKANERFFTFQIPGDKKLSVIAERIEAIWQE